MNTLDIVLIILLVLSNLNGIRQGLVKALLGLVGWFLALLLAIRFSPEVKPLMAQYTADPTLQKIAAFASIIAVVMILTWFIGFLLHKILQQMRLTWLNRLAGGGFGLAKSIIIILVLINGLAPWLSQTKIWQNSAVVGLLVPYSAQATAYTQDVVRKTADGIEDSFLDEASSSTNETEEDEASSGREVANPFF